MAQRVGRQMCNLHARRAFGENLAQPLRVLFPELAFFLELLLEWDRARCVRADRKSRRDYLG